MVVEEKKNTRSPGHLLGSYLGIIEFVSMKTTAGLPIEQILIV